MEDANFFSGSSLDRLAEKREDKEFILRVLNDHETKFLLFAGLNPFVSVSKIGENEPNFGLLFVSFQDILKYCIPPGNGFSDTQVTVDNLTADNNFVFLGGKQENFSKTHFIAVNVSEDRVKLIEREKAKEIKILASRSEILKLNKFDAALVAQSRSLLDWNKRNVFCPACGSKTISEDAGYRRKCKNDDCLTGKGVYNTSYPRTDPVVISVVSSVNGQQILLGRKKTFPPKMFSCLAGFMEPGESIEEAVRREVQEESGIAVGPVKYVSSQPWPYPSVIMIGCISQAESEEITVCLEELEDARWFSTSDVESAMRGTSDVLCVPPHQTIAHQLIKTWYQSIKAKKV